MSEAQTTAAVAAAEALTTMVSVSRQMRAHLDVVVDDANRATTSVAGGAATRRCQICALELEFT